MDTPARILYVEDDEVLSFVTKDNLELKGGYEITHCGDGKEGLKTFKENPFDLCILDVMLPEMDGFQLAREIRKLNTQIPILFLTAKSLKEDKIDGLKLGADDYITKPFSIEELELKVKIFLKRKYVHQNENTPTVFNLGKYEFDYGNLKLIFADQVKNLTQKEGDLLRLFILSKNTILKRAEILEKIWGQDDYFMGRSMDVFISRLRKYLNQDDSIKLENVHGVGFRFVMN